MAAGERLENQVFLITQKDLRTTTQGSLYIHLVLADRTGQFPGRMWQATEEVYATMPEGGFLRFTGRVENYKGSLQFIVDAVRPAKEAEIDLGDFLPNTERDVDEMWEKVKAILRTIEHPQLLQLIKQFVQDEPLTQAFRRSPAAVQMHHAFLGGLLEHTLNLLELAQLVIPRYPQVSLDLVLAGAFLHDIGKTAELSCDTSFQYSDTGHLVGHIVQSALWIENKAAAVEADTGEPFPKEIREALIHIVLSHHGTHEFGSPKLPAMPEAIALHHLDNLDAKLQMYLHHIESDPDPKSDWTKYVRGLDTRIYKGDPLGIRSR
jgi:3'-5' exoribonuclease